MNPETDAAIYHIEHLARSRVAHPFLQRCTDGDVLAELAKIENQIIVMTDDEARVMHLSWHPNDDVERHNARIVSTLCPAETSSRDLMIAKRSIAFEVLRRSVEGQLP